MVCSSCDKQRANLSTKKSRLMPGMTLFMCEECIKAKREPRYVIVLSARDALRVKDMVRFSLVGEYIRSRRYVGDDILGREIL